MSQVARTSRWVLCAMFTVSVELSVTGCGDSSRTPSDKTAATTSSLPSSPATTPPHRSVPTAPPAVIALETLPVTTIPPTLRLGEPIEDLWSARLHGVPIEGGPDPRWPSSFQAEGRLGMGMLGTDLATGVVQLRGPGSSVVEPRAAGDEQSDSDRSFVFAAGNEHAAWALEDDARSIRMLPAGSESVELLALPSAEGQATPSGAVAVGFVGDRDVLAQLQLPSGGTLLARTSGKPADWHLAGSPLVTDGATRIVGVASRPKTQRGCLRLYDADASAPSWTTCFTMGSIRVDPRPIQFGESGAHLLVWVGEGFLVVDSATGRPMRRFVTAGPPPHASDFPWFEDDEHVLQKVVEDGADRADAVKTRMWVVRCSLAGACELATAPTAITLGH